MSINKPFGVGCSKFTFLNIKKCAEKIANFEHPTLAHEAMFRHKCFCFFVKD